MKSIQQLIALGLIIFLSINLATAQRGNNSKDPEAMAKQQTERMTERLSLNESQTTQVAAINLSYAEKMKAAMDATTDQETRKATMNKLRTEKSTAIKAVLTPEQLAQYEAKGNSKNVSQKGKCNKKGAKYSKANKGQKAGTPQERAQQQTDRMNKRLSLSETQVTEVAAINLSYAQKMEAAKATTTGKESTKAEMKKFRTEKSAAIKALLTPEQLATYEASQKRREEGKNGKCNYKGGNKSK